jgi:aminoglycoside phosphotransferase (APT) family kinase protein
MLREGQDTKKIDKILDFIQLMTERVQSKGNVPIILVLTHGDFCPANMLNTKNGLRVLDWESATIRSALFDFYSYFFFRAVHQNLSLDTLRTEISVALPFLITRLDVQAPDISGSMQAFEEVYRWLYYIERIYMLMEREKDDRKHNIIEVLLRFINVFNDHEKLSPDYTANK